MTTKGSLSIAYILINANRREGTSRAVVEVAERLALRHQVTVFSRTAESLDQSLVTWRPVKAPSWPDVAEFECFRVNVERMLRSENFDLIHSAGCNVWNADVYTIQTVHPKKMEVNQIHSRNSQVSPLRRFTRAMYDRQVLRSERHAYRAHNSRGIVGYLPVSQGTEVELRSCYQVQDCPIDVVPNGADLKIFHPGLKASHRADVRLELGCTEDNIVFLFAGGEWNRKGLGLAIEALAKTTTNNNLLIVAGDDPQRKQYVELAEKFGIANRIRWIGFRTDIQRIYAASDLFLFPSAYEAFSLATIEAAATGLPVIMCDICGAAELLGDGLGGQIVERNADAIAAAMNSFASDPVRRHDAGLHARAKVEANFHWDGIANRTEAFYRRLLAARCSNAELDD